MEKVKINHIVLLSLTATLELEIFVISMQMLIMGRGKINGKNTPIIGNNVWIGPGTKLFGKITIADYCQISAIAVVNKSFTTPRSVLVGCSAKVVK